MKIGLVRHFKVAHEFPTGKSVTADDMKQWFVDYDAADYLWNDLTWRGGMAGMLLQ